MFNKVVCNDVFIVFIANVISGDLGSSPIQGLNASDPGTSVKPRGSIWREVYGRTVSKPEGQEVF